MLRRPRAAPTRCPSTTATASSSTWSPSTTATRATARSLERLWPHVAARRRLHRRRCAQQRAHRGVPRAGQARVLRPAAASRSATRATRRSRCTPTGTTSSALRGSRTRSSSREALGERRGGARASPRSARRVPRRPPRVDRARAIARARDRLHPRLAPSSATSTPPRPRSRSRPAASSTRLPQPSCCDAPSSATGEEFAARRDGTREWDAYTPYELRNVGAFVRLGWRERAHELLDCFLDAPPPGRLEPVGRGRRPRRRASRASSATCRTPGSARTSSARCSTCSPTSARPTSRWCSAPACPTPGWRARASTVRGLRTPLRAARLHAAREAGDVLDADRDRACGRRAASSLRPPLPCAASHGTPVDGAVDDAGRERRESFRDPCGAVLTLRTGDISGSGREQSAPLRRESTSRVEPRARLRRALLRREVDVHDAEALRVAEAPLEVVEQRPGEVAAQVDALPRSRRARRARCVAQVGDAQRIVDAAVRRRPAGRRRRRRSR